MVKPYIDIGHCWYPESPDDHNDFSKLNEFDKRDFMIGWKQAETYEKQKYDFDVSLCGTPSQIIDFHESNLESLDFEQFKKVTFAILRKMNEKLENL